MTTEIMRKEKILGGHIALSAGLAVGLGKDKGIDPLALLGYYRPIGKNSNIKVGVRAGALYDLSARKLRGYGGVGVTFGF